MKRVTLIIIAVLMAGSMLRAQYNDFSIGLRGGTSTYFTMDNLKPQFGGLGGFDFNYSFLTTNDSVYYIGLRTGISVAYSTFAMDGAYQDHFENVWNNAYNNGMHIDYTVTAGNVHASTSQLQLEIPLMGQFQVKGFTMALGMKFMFPVMSTTNQTISDDWKISAYFQEMGYSLVNDNNHDLIAIGDITDEMRNQTRKSCVPTFNAMTSLEIGYEWGLGAEKKSALGLLVYLDYSLWNTFKSEKSATNRFVNIEPAEGAAEMPAKTTVGMMYNLMADEMNYFSVGAKLYYRFRAKSHPKGSYGYGRMHKEDVPELMEKAEEETKEETEQQPAE